MTEEEIEKLYIKRSRCHEDYVKCRGKGYTNFRAGLKFIIDNVDLPMFNENRELRQFKRDVRNMIVQCNVYPESKKGEHIKLFEKLLKDK